MARQGLLEIIAFSSGVLETIIARVAANDDLLGGAPVPLLCILGHHIISHASARSRATINLDAQTPLPTQTNKKDKSS